MNNYYQCEATSTTKDKTLAKESNLPMATMFIYIFIFIAICFIVFIFYRENSNIANANIGDIRVNFVLDLFINLINTIIKYRQLFVLLLLFILFGIFITAIVNVSA